MRRPTSGKQVENESKYPHIVELGIADDKLDAHSKAVGHGLPAALPLSPMANTVFGPVSSGLSSRSEAGGNALHVRPQGLLRTAEERPVRPENHIPATPALKRYFWGNGTQSRTVQAKSRRSSGRGFAVFWKRLDRRGVRRNRQVASQDLMRGQVYNVSPVVSRDGEHHDATRTTWNFCCRHDRARGVRLHYDAEVDKKAINGNFAVSGAERTSAQLFRSRRRKGP
jgi:hypothetical protein